LQQLAVSDSYFPAELDFSGGYYLFTLR